jgi:hypothetical protein
MQWRKPDEAPAAAPPVRSTAAERMRRHRLRRRRGLRTYRVELSEAAVTALIQDGWVKTDARNRLSPVRGALYLQLDRTLGSDP